MRRALAVCVAVGALATAGCATGAGPAPEYAQEFAPARRPPAPRTTLEAAELAAVGPVSAYEAVRRLRPEFLVTRGVSTITNGAGRGPVVYVDGMRAGGVGELRYIPARDVVEIRHRPAHDAQTRLGSGHPDGVIEVRTRRG